MWISQAEARQRAGRAGRVQPGVVYKLYTRHRAKVNMVSARPPEMLRGPLQEICLQLRLALGVQKATCGRPGALGTGS